MTRDERRYLAIRAAWSSGQQNKPNVELLSFPRVAGAYRVVSATPEFRISPRLPNDPAVWGGGSGRFFVLEAPRMECRRMKGFSETGLFLLLQDEEERSGEQIRQVWHAFFFNVLASAFFSLGVTLFPYADWYYFGVFSLLAAPAVLILTLWLLVPAVQISMKVQKVRKPK